MHCDHLVSESKIEPAFICVHLGYGAGHFDEAGHGRWIRPLFRIG
jgi:hypothetical protein